MGLLEKYGNRYGFNTQQYAQPQQVANLEQTEQNLQQRTQPINIAQTPQAEFTAPQPQSEFNAPPAPIAPQAPSTENLNQGKSQGRGLFDLSRLKDEAQDFIQNIKSGGDAFRSKDDLMKTEIARIRNDGGLLQTLTRGDEKTAEITKQNKANIENIAKKHGYDLGVEIDDDGKVYFGKSGENGEPIIKEVTPSFLNDMGAYRNEILGALALTALTGGQNIPLLFATSATGSALGAGADFHNRDELTQENETAKDYLSRMGGAVADDLVGGAIVGGIAKGGKALINHAPSVKNALNTTAELGGKVWDNLPITQAIRHISTDGLGRAEKALNEQLGGEAQVLKSTNKATQALGESGYNQFVNETPLNIPKTGNTTIDKGIDFANKKVVEPIANTVKRVVSDSNLNQREADMLLASMAHENGAKIIKNAVVTDPQAYLKANEIFSNLNTSARQSIETPLKDTPSVVRVFDDYEKRVKSDYAQVVDTLGEVFKEPVSTAKTAEIKRNILLSLQDSGYPLNSQYRTLVNETLQKPTDFKAWNELRNYTNAEIGKLTKNGVNDAISFDRVEALSAIKNKIDEAMEEIYEAEIKSPKFANASKELMEQARADYKVFKELETSKLYKEISSGIKNESDMVNKLISSIGNENGVGAKEFLESLGNKDRALIENGIIKNVIAKNTIDGVTDFKAVTQTLNNFPIQTEQASNILKYLNENSAILNNTSEILGDLKNITPRPRKKSQGIGSSAKGRGKVMVVSNFMDKVYSKIPFWGDTYALNNHIARALKNAGNIETAIKNLGKIPTENMPSEAIKQLDEFKKLFESEFKNSVKTANNQVAENLAQAEAKQAENVGKFGDDLDILQMAKDKQQAENLAKNEPIKGDNFVTENPNLTKPKSDLSVEITANKRTMEHLGIDTDKLFADLDTLLNKHPELGKPSTIYKIIKAVQDEPNRYFKNNRPDIDLIAKDLQDGTLGKMGIVNQGENIGKIGHLSVTSENKKGREVERLLKKSKDGSAVETPRSTLRENGQTAGAKSTFAEPKSDDIIPQFDKFKNKKGVEVIDEADIIKIQAKTPTGDIQEFIYFKDDGKFFNRTIDQDKTRILHSGDFKIKSIDDLENAINKSLGENVSQTEPKELIKKREQLAKLEKELQETRAKNQKIVLPPNQSNNSKRTQIRNLSNKARDLEYKINELQKEITLLDPKSTSREKLLAEYGETYQNGIKKMFSDLKDGTKKYPLEKDLQKGTLDFQNIQKMRDWNTRYYDIKPLPQHGTNYAEFYHDGIGAFNKIKAEKSGQVSGAFHRSDLGDIDLVWGAIKDQNGKVQGYGLSKIVVKHKEITPEILDDIITNGKVTSKQNEAVKIEKDGYRIILKSNWFGEPTKNKWVVTAYDNQGDKIIKSEKGTSISSEPFTKADNLALNSDNNIISKSAENINANLKPKTGAELKAEFDDLSEKYDIEAFLKDRENISANDIRYTRTAVNGSSSKTSRKNTDGTYTYSKPEMEHNYKADFTFTKQDTARLRKQIQSGEFDEALLKKLKNDLDGAEPQGYTNYLKSADDIAESKAEKEFKQTGKEPEIKELKDGRIWDNKHGKYIYMFSNESLGGGVLGGSVSGIQTDENGNIIGFDPADFAKGFIGGAIATKALKETAIKGAKIYADKVAKAYPNIAKSNPKLFAEIVNKSAKEKFGNLAVESGEILQKGIRKLVGEATDFNKKVIGGENALLSLKDTTHKANLAKAKAMQEKGTSELEIWEKTGWYKDELDGKWKFEINPSGGELKRNVLKYGKAYKLSEVLDDKELFEAYPQLSEVKVITSNNLQNGFTGSFNQETKIIKIASNNANIKNTLYHEIQHAVQEIENFSKGSNLDNPAIKNYARTKNLAEYYDDKIKEHYKKHDEIIKKYGVQSKEFKNWADELEHLGRKFEAQLKDESYETYLRQGGEAEARNVSNRLNGGDKNIQSFDDFVKLSKEQGDNFSDSELRQMYLNLQKNTKPTHPLETLDIPRNERLNLGGDGVSEARNLPNKEKRGIYNVAFNDKKSTQIYKDLDDIEQAIKFEKGRADTEKNGKIKSGFGALHIKKHTEPNKFGYVTTQEYLNMGEVVRNGEMSQVGQKRVYKLTKDGVTFRVVIGDSKNKKERIISFYSDRKAK